MYIRTGTIIAVMAAIYGFVLGFGYGNLFDAQYGFQLKEWQTLAGVLVAVAAATLAYLGVQSTQRINVVIKEQDRLDALLPGLRQVNELLLTIRGPLSNLRTRHLYQSYLLLDAAIPVGPKELVEDAVRRLLPLADDHLKWEVAQLAFALKSQAVLLKLGKEEVDRCQKDVANIRAFAADQHDSVRYIAKQVEEAHDRESAVMQRHLVSLNDFAGVVKERIAKAEKRQNVIRSIVDKYFKED